MLSQMKGLNAFITDIRGCQNKEQEQNRCEQELSKIKTQFANDRNMTGYHKKKYIWKLLYMYILGYEIDIGHQDAAFLINCPKFSEKYTGYVATSILINEEQSDIFQSISGSIRSDLNSGNEVFQSMALAMVGAQAPLELVKTLKEDIIRLALEDSHNKSSYFVKKKAILCLLRMYRKYQDQFDPNLWIHSIIKMFDQVCWSLGYLCSLTTIVIGLSQFIDLTPFKDITPKVIKMLEKLVITRDCPKDYLYYQTPNPWLQVKLLKLIQKLPFPENGSDANSKLMVILQKIIQKTEVTKHQNKNNADHGILFEASKVILLNYEHINEKLKKETVQLLGIFIQVKEPNIRYLALETVCQFNDAAVCEMIMGEYLKYILSAMKDQDISIKRRALDILYHMCHQKVAHLVIEEMLTFIENSDVDFQEELVLKVAILAEKFACDLQWYFDTIVHLIQTAGNLITNDVWYRLLQMITGFNDDDNTTIRQYAALKLYQLLQKPYVNQTLVKLAAYILPEFSHLLVNNQHNISELNIFETLHSHYLQTDYRTKALMLNGFAKLATRYSSLEMQALIIFQSLNDHVDIELQQRSLEFLFLFQQEPQIRAKVLSIMPNFNSTIQNSNPLIKKICNLKGGKNDKNIQDPTVLLQAKKIADEEMNMFQTKSSILQQSHIMQQEQEEQVKRLQQHELYSECIDKLCLKSNNIMKSPVDKFQNLIEQSSNGVQIKQLLTQGNGLIYSDDSIQVQYKSEFNDGQGRIGMQFENLEGKKMTEVSVLIHNSQGLLVNISPVKYNNNHPVIMVQVIANSPVMTLPIATLYYNINSTQHKIHFTLPISQIQFVQPVSLNPQAILSFYKEYTYADNPSYHRLDDFIRNPAPENVDLNEVMKKIGFLLVSLKMKVSGVPTMENIEQLNGAGQFQYQNEQDEMINIPIVIQVQSFAHNKKYLRISFRSAVSPDIIKIYYQFINFVINSNSTLY